jgi:hypothetical protein
MPTKSSTWKANSDQIRLGDGEFVCRWICFCLRHSYTGARSRNELPDGTPRSGKHWVALRPLGGAARRVPTRESVTDARATGAPPVRRSCRKPRISCSTTERLVSRDLDRFELATIQLERELVAVRGDKLVPNDSHGLYGEAH